MIGGDITETYLVRIMNKINAALLLFVLPAGGMIYISQFMA